MVTHICSLKNAATIVQQEAGNFNMAHFCSYQKGSPTILYMRKRDAHSKHMQYKYLCKKDTKKVILKNCACLQTLFLSLTSNPAPLRRCSTIGKCPFPAALWSAVSFASVRANMWTPILGARYWATPTWPPPADRWKALNPPYGCAYNISKIQYIRTYVDLGLNTTSKSYTTTYACNHHCLNGCLHCVQASVVVHCRDIDTNTSGSILGAVDSTSKAITNRCSTHSMAYCLFSALALWWFTILYTNMLWWNLKGQSRTVQQQSLLHTHSTITSTDCHLMHYGWLTVILWVQPHMMIGYMHNSLNHSLPLTVCMALTFFLCRMSAPKVSHSSCTRPLWP